MANTSNDTTKIQNYLYRHKWWLKPVMWHLTRICEIFYMMGGTWTNINFSWKKIYFVLVYHKLKMNKQYVTIILVSFKKQYQKKGSKTLLWQMLFPLHLDYSLLMWNPYFKSNVNQQVDLLRRLCWQKLWKPSHMKDGRNGGETC